MAWTQPKVNWKAGDAPNSGDFNRIEGNSLELFNSSIPFLGTAVGTNNYVLNNAIIANLYKGASFKVEFQNTSTGTSTLNINNQGAKPILRANGNPIPSGMIRANQIMHLCFNGVDFTILGEGGEYGNVARNDVLSGVIFGTEEGLQEGTMPNEGAIYLKPSPDKAVRIPRGYHNGNGSVYRIQRFYKQGTIFLDINTNQRKEVWRAEEDKRFVDVLGYGVQVSGISWDGLDISASGTQGWGAVQGLNLKSWEGQVWVLPTFDREQQILKIDIQNYEEPPFYGTARFDWWIVGYDF